MLCNGDEMAVKRRRANAFGFAGKNCDTNCRKGGTMRSRSAFAPLMLLVTALLITSGCDGVTGTREAVAIPDIAISTEFANGFSGCTTPKPDDIGCTTMCKPCITSFCVNKTWVRQDIDWPPEICEPRPDPLPPTGCPRTDTGFCPAECHICF